MKLPFYSVVVLILVILTACSSGQNKVLESDDLKKSVEIETGEIKTHLEDIGRMDFSPDDTQIVFRAGIIDTGIYLLDLLTGKIDMLVKPVGENTDPRFSPDGKTIVFHSDGKIKTISVNGNNLKTLTDSDGDFDPDYTPYGDILFSSWNPTPELWLMDSEGESMEQLSHVGYAGMSSMSNDGTKIVFIFGEEFDEIYLSQNVAVMDSDGKNLNILTDKITQDISPRFNHDGSKIVFYSGAGGFNTEIRMINIDGTEISKLKTDYNNPLAPTFNNKGDKLAYTSTSNSHLIIIENVQDLIWERIY